MSALITGILTYLGTDLLMALLARVGIKVGAATIVAAAGKETVAHLDDVVAFLKSRRRNARGEQREELDKQIDKLSIAQRSVRENWFP